MFNLFYSTRNSGILDCESSSATILEMLKCRKLTAYCDGQDMETRIGDRGLTQGAVLSPD